MADGVHESINHDDSPEETSNHGRHHRAHSDAATEDFASIPGSSHSRSSSCASCPPSCGTKHRSIVEQVSLSQQTAFALLPSQACEKVVECSEVSVPLAAMDTTSDRDEEMIAVEKELTKEVPMLLESLNRSSSDVNALERQASDAQERYSLLLEQWNRLHEEMRLQYGQTIDIARPYYEASQAVHVTSQYAKRIVHEFSAASSQHLQAKAELRAIEKRLAHGGNQFKLDTEQQDCLSRATLRVLKCQQARDKCERDYVKILQDYREAQESVEFWRTEVGDTMIVKTWPCFRQLQQHQSLLTAAEHRINSLLDRAKKSKNSYQNSLRELDRINMAVHSARGESVSSSSKVSLDSSQRPETLLADDGTRSETAYCERNPSTPPEVSPEPEGDSEIEASIRRSTSHKPSFSIIAASPFDDEIGLSKENFLTSCTVSEEFAFGAPEEAGQRKSSGGVSSDVGIVDDGPFA